jgi:hypothetical protein
VRQSDPILIKVRDMAIGLFGWLIIGNLLLLLLVVLEYNAGLDFEQMYYSLGLIMWSFSAVTIGIFIKKKRFWVCVGIAVDLVINIGYWTAMLLTRSDYTLVKNVMLAGLPLPTGLLIMFSAGP